MPQIEIIKSSIGERQGPKGPYKAVETVYKVDGKVKTINVFQFNKAVYPVLSAAQSGDLFDVQFVQNDKGFWEIQTIMSAGKKEPGTTEASPAATSPTGRSSNWETSEERAARQVMIVKQSQLTNAIAYLNLVGNKKATGQEVIGIAREFVDYVLGTDTKFVTEESDIA